MAGDIFVLYCTVYGVRNLGELNLFEVLISRVLSALKDE